MRSLPTRGRRTAVRRRAALALVAGLVAPAAAQATVTLFLDRCPAGCTILKHSNPDSCLNRSPLVSGPRDLSPFAHGDAAWAELLDCVRSVLAPYDVAVTDVDPGCATHNEVVVAGTSAELGYPNSTLGVAPATCTPLVNANAFALANSHGNMRELCWTVAHEYAHMLAVDHEGLQRDPMTYEDGCLVKRFAAREANCGPYSSQPQACLCGGTTQSSDALLRATLGDADGPFFRDGFDGWSLRGEDEEGSTCHWDLAAGELEEESAPGQPAGRPAGWCATGIPVSSSPAAP